MLRETAEVGSTIVISGAAGAGIYKLAEVLILALTRKGSDGNDQRVLETKIDNLNETCREGFARQEEAIKELSKSLMKLATKGS